MNNRNTQAVAAMTERLRTSPVPFPRMARPDVVRTVTSGDAGKAIPLAFIPLQREDALETTRFQARAYMQETADLLLNSVNCVFSAWLVPKLAFDRFEQSLDALNRAYLGQQEKDGSTIPWIDTHVHNNREVYQAAGLHAAATTTAVNTDFVEAYDKVFEYRCRERSEALWEAVRDTVTNSGQLHPAFFDNPQMSIVKPSFDPGATEGVVPLTLIDGQLPVQGLGFVNASGTSGNATVKYTGGTENVTGEKGWTTEKDAQAVATGRLFMKEDANNVGFPAVFAELESEGITVSLANIDMAKQTQAWARIRNQYSGIEDDDLVDLLMSGITLPTLSMARPQLIDRKVVPFGMTQRYSSDAESLDVSATRGMAGTELTLRTPVVNTGAVVVVQVEIVPEQFWERSKDYHFLADNDTRRPDRLLDELDPQAIEVVTNDHADVAHTDPEGIFGYAPLNHGLIRRRFNIGGKFFRDDPTAPFDENRNRIWASEPVDPTLSKELYLATDLNEDIFLQQIVDNFEFSGACDAVISGLTFVGPMLREATGDYQHILDRVDTARIVPPATTAEAVEQQTETVEAPAETQEEGTDDEVSE